MPTYPHFGVAIVTPQGVERLVVTGVRRRGEEVAATEHDLWHLGSCGKAMTATLVARLVERGLIGWEDTLGQHFQDEAVQDSPLARATLIELLAHRSGVPANFDVRAYAGRQDVKAARRVRDAPGSRFEYSNWGYTIVAAMLEQATGKSFETLLAEELFAPLGMASAGFGGTGTPGRLDQPWPHDAAGRPYPHNGPEADHPPVLSPAGRMHMRLEDWARFVAEHLRGARGESRFLKPESWRRLHTPVGEDYALGWLAPQRPWAQGRALHHAGDNTLNFALVWAAPQAGFAVLVVTNQSGASKAADRIASEAILARLSNAPR
ncbi:MAG: beta-lactamase family protein [Casimicrobiaceae bacterium]|nr:beta-lactamase family protein [Casimicrobiaceae bacterium]